MTKSSELDAYFQRVGWGGDTSPTLPTLAGLLRAHVRAIPFENLDTLLERPVRLERDAIFDKLVRARRGGYCFEHATLFADVLERLGFHPARHSARVVLFTPRAQSARGHMFLTVPLEADSFVVDPGFGGPAADFPVPLVDTPQPPEGTTHWMARDDGAWVLRTRAGDAAKDAWVSDLAHDNAADFEMANHFTQTHPKSIFLGALMMSRFTENGRITVLNGEATFREGREARTMQISSRAALKAMLAEHFGIDFPEVDQLRTAFIPQWRAQA